MLLLLLLLILVFGGLAIFVARVFLIALVVVLVLGLLGGGFMRRCHSDPSTAGWHLARLGRCDLELIRLRLRTG